MAKSPVFDTSVFSSYKQQIEKQIGFSLVATVVLYELAATNIDSSTFQKYERWRGLLANNGQLLCPTANDWWETAKTVRRLYLKKSAPVSKLRTLQNDALIARLAVKNGGFVVTMNVDDFELIAKEMPRLEVVPADYFFS